MNVKDIVKGLLNKSLKLDEIPEDKIDEVIIELKSQRDELAKGSLGDAITALQGKGSPFTAQGGTAGTSTATPSMTTPPPTATATSSSPSIAEQINFGGDYRPVNKEEVFKVHSNGQWDIKPVEKSGNEKADDLDE